MVIDCKFRKLIRIATGFLFLLALNPSFAVAGSNQSLVYQGRIIRPDGSVLNSGTVAFTLKVYSPSPAKCLLYSETQSLDMNGSAGMFSLALGAGTRTDGLSHAFNKIFVNGGSLTGLTCANGLTSYSPSSTDDRLLEASFNDSGVTVNLSALQIKSIPFALQAAEIGGFGVNDIVKIHPTTGSASTFTVAEMAVAKTIAGLSCAVNEVMKWNGTAWACSSDATGGSPSDASYLAKGIVQFDTNASTSGITVASGVAKLSDVNSDVGTFGSATKTVTLTVNAQGRITGASHQDIAIPASQITQSSAANGDVLKWNGTNWAPAADAGTTTDASYAAKGIVQFDSNAATSGVTVTSGVAKVNFGTGANQIVKLDGSGRLPAIDGSQLTNVTATGYSGTLGVTNGGTGASTFTSNGVLLGNGTSAVSGTAAGTAHQVFRVPSGGGAPAFGSMDLSQSAAVTGTLGVGNGGTGQSSYTAGDILYATGASATGKLGIGASGTVLTSNGSSPSWGTLASAGAFVNGGNTFTATATLGTNSNHDLEFETNGTTKMTINTAGQVGIGTTTMDDLLDIRRTSGAWSSVTTVGGQEVQLHGAYSTDEYGERRLSFYKYRGTWASPLAVQNGDLLSTIHSNGYDGSGSVQSSSIRAWVDGAVSPGVVPTRLEFATMGTGALTTRMTVNSAGYVGIGTTSPDVPLEIDKPSPATGFRYSPLTIWDSGGMHIGPHSIDNRFNVIAGASNSAGWDMHIGVDGGANTYGKVHLVTGTSGNSTPRLSVNQAGDVGIGTTDPYYKLQVLGPNKTTASNDTIAFIHSSDSQAQDLGGSLGLGGHDGVNGSRTFGVISGRKENSVSGNTAGYLSLATRPAGGNSTERIRISSTGNVGIGNSDPDSIFDISGAFTQRGMAVPAVSASGQGRIYFSTADNKFKVSQNGAAYVDLVGGGSSGVTGVTAGTGLLVGTTAGGTISSTGTLNINVGTGANQIVQLDGSGKLPVLDGSALTNLSAANITAGTLAVGRGGTGATTLTSNGVLLGNGTSAVSATAAGAAYSVLRVPSGGGAPAFGAIDLSQSAAVTGTLPIANGGTGMTSFGVDRLIGTTGAGALQTVTCGQYKVLSFNASGVYGCYDVGDIYPGFTNGGNTSTATMVLGTNSNQDLEIESNGASRLFIMKDGRVGVGQAPSNFFDVAEGTDHTANQTFYTSVVSNSHAPTSPSDSVVYAFDGMTRYDSAINSPNANLTGVSGDVGNWSTGTLGNARGTNGSVNNWDAGNINSASGVEGRVENVAGGTIDSATALYGQVVRHSTGPINNGYGLYIDAINATNKWSIYASDATAKSYFAGKVGVGNSDPYHKFEVRGSDEDVVGRVMNASSTSARYPSFNVENFKGATSGYPHMMMINSNGSSSAPSFVLEGDHLGGLIFAGASDTNWNYRHGALISATAAQDFNLGSGTHLKFWTTPNNTNGEVERMRIEENGNVGIGTNDPTHKLHVAGSVKIVDGTQGNGKVLTSDANGVASWQNPSGGGSGAMTLISTQTASGSAELVWTGISGTPKSLMLECSGIRPDTNSVQLRMQYGEGVTPTWLAANYSWYVNTVSPGGSAGIGASSVGTYIALTRETTGGLGTGNAARNFNGRLMLSNFGSTSDFKYVSGTITYHATAGSFQQGTMGGSYEGSTNAVTAIRIYFSSGNIAAGSCSLYSLAN